MDTHEIEATPAPSESSLRDTILTYESMLDVFPEDISAMEALINVYAQVNDLEKLRGRAHILLPLLSSGGDWRRVSDIARMVLQSVPDDATCRKALEEAAMLLGEIPTAEEMESGLDAPLEGEGIPERCAPSQELSFDLRCELDLAYHLLTREVISQSQYEAAIDRLTESSLSRSASSPLCLLQELADLERIDIERVVDFLANDSTVPFLELSCCECQMKAVDLLPLAQAKRLGVLPFDMIGNDLMVSLLNPVSKELRERLVAHFGGKLHFFFTSPEQFSLAITHIQESKAKGG